MMTFLFLTRVNFSSDIKPFPYPYWELPPLNNDVKSHDSKSKVKVRKHLSTEGCWYHLLKMNIFCAIFVAQFCYTNGAKPNFILMLMDDVSKFCWHFIYPIMQPVYHSVQLFTVVIIIPFSLSSFIFLLIWTYEIIFTFVMIYFGRDIYFKQHILCTLWHMYVLN